MTTCPKCGYTRRNTETAPDYECPKCGVVYAKAAGVKTPAGPLKKRSKHVSPWMVGFAVVGLVGFIYAAANIDGTRPTQRAAQREAAREPVYNSGWDGSVRQVERFLKDTLKDPSSFQAVQWYPVQKDADGYVVRVRYRARNSFGALVLEDRVFLLDRAGNLVR